MIITRGGVYPEKEATRIKAMSALPPPEEIMQTFFVTKTKKAATARISGEEEQPAPEPVG